MPKLLDVFDVEKASLVINLMDSDCYPSNFERDFDLHDLDEQERKTCTRSNPSVINS